MLKFLVLGLWNTAVFTATDQFVPTENYIRPSPSCPRCESPSPVPPQAIHAAPPTTPAPGGVRSRTHSRSASTNAT